ncbi:hypothetical protein PYS60_05955 [Amygdalobacter indicium]|uniref:hypothetical protein n=1 Tax=Amygdalobacter indicium TaxID=3029272 RepID=UPI0027A4FAC2|nr:hypothetical protein [Amygdalobacter indicium]WEG34227.1 hypothetical protein PYS60_05955 [Amygdalobacter indicium]
MKKIITLALATVMTLGLTVLPKADSNNYASLQKKVKDAEKAVKTAEEAVETAKKDKTTTLEKLGQLEKAVETAKKALEDAKKKLQANDYGYVTIKDEETGKVYADAVEVPAGTYTPAQLIELTGAEKNSKDGLVAAEGSEAVFEIKDHRHANVLVKVQPLIKYTIHPLDEEGRSLGHAFDVTKKTVAKFVTALEVAPKELTFDAAGVKGVDVNGYFVLDTESPANAKHVYVGNYTKGGVVDIYAVYTKATAKKYTDKNGKPVKGTKNGQVGKTGEVATVATGIGALMTLAGVVVATKRH